MKFPKVISSEKNIEGKELEFEKEKEINSSDSESIESNIIEEKKKKKIPAFEKIHIFKFYHIQNNFEKVVEKIKPLKFIKKTGLNAKQILENIYYKKNPFFEDRGKTTIKSY